MLPVFNVRVYGILVENEDVLISDEIHHGRIITKFPGGGLQFGEGTIECIKREFIEELELKVEVEEHFYTVDFFQPSAFDPTQQVISIYYFVSSTESSKIKTAATKISSSNDDGLLQSFRKLKISELSEDEFTFPIDKRVAKMLIKKFNGQV